MSKAPKTLSQEQLTTLVAWLGNHHHNAYTRRLAVRNVCMTLLMSHAGLRVGEMTKLTQNALIFDSQPVEALYIPAEITKNKRDRTIPMSIHIRRAIEDLKNEVWRTTNANPDKPAFCGASPIKPIQIRTVELMIKNAGMQALNFPVNPHMLRHTFATKMMRVTNARTVQELLGHKSLTSTQVYTHPNGDDLKKAITALD